MTRDGAQALLVIAGSLTFFGSKRIAELALTHKLPSCHAFKETVAAGGLVSLGPRPGCDEHTRRELRRQDNPGAQAGRPSRRATHSLRDARKLEDRKGAWDQ